MLSEDLITEDQNKAIDFIYENEKSALFLPMSFGKTVIALTCINRVLEDGEFFGYRRKILIVSPLKVANTVWRNEAKLWEHLQNLTFSLCTGSPKNRLENLHKDSQIYIVNNENLGWLYSNARFFFDMVVIDESSKYKSFKSKRFKTMLSLSMSAHRIVLLTGTPMSNGLMDLWSQLFLLDRGDRLGRTITSYREKYFNARPVTPTVNIYNEKKGAYDEVKNKICDICYYQDRDLSDMVNIGYFDEHISLDGSIKDIYSEMEKEFVITLNDVGISSPSSAQKVNKLLQICNGFIYDEEGRTHILHDLKLNKLKELLTNELSGENVIVAYNYKADLKVLQSTFDNSVTMNPDGREIEDWNAGKIKVLLAHPASCGHGLNAQFGGSTIIWFGLPWSLELYEQFNSRVYRTGQKSDVKIIHLISEGTVETKVLNALQSKSKNQKEFLQKIKEYYT